ncbi:MAG: hypothetical protein QMD76_01470 [Anaerosomatales bacterium]|jgi:hypothetical protein|uniref:DUF7670 domain-containing protein n=1 Tax=Parvivirga hydrogeniphila TaxID=2939460 RepID=UPI0019C2D6B9|nr:hypothetical protein [Parvivirga hydrogeniphila]MBC7265391.1 hypothetical protein [Coriobacteriia bacterium]MCL4078106.1 hypothetical protein [Parvivirga hydrogeniphila]MDI6691970.1 hypothetical protein [Anaerosomatales bacterium]
MELLAKVCKTEEMNFERLFARIFVAGGGLFWVAGVLGMDLGYRDKSVFEAAGSAAIPLAITIAALAIGWFYENLAGVLLLAGSIATVVWGIVAGWESGVWFIMMAVLAAPMAIAGVLFLLAARMQKICELKG